jgi:hypothetical protein
MFVYALILLSLLAAALIIVSHKLCKSKLLDEWEAGDENIAIKFQRNWLSVFGLVQVAQWMQAPYLFLLYEIGRAHV